MAKLIILDGIVGSKEVKELPSGTMLLSFSVATKRWDGKETVTDWIQCKIFGKRAKSKLVNMIVTGSKVSLEGTFTTNRPDKITYFDCLVDEITVHKVGNDAKFEEPSEPDVNQEESNSLDSDDIPF